MTTELLRVEGLSKRFPIHGGILHRQVASVHAVTDVSFSILPGETLGMVGESGCGKSTIGRTLVRLYEPCEGKVVFDGKDITHMSRKELRPIRRELQMIFQDPFESLNPRLTVAQILAEPFLIHERSLGPTERQRKVAALLDRVGLSRTYLSRYPHEFSGGQRQRIGIARAIALEPKLIVCDEPVSALDVSIQSQILNLMMELQREMGLSYLFIAHDLSVVKHISDRIAVMYLGHVVEIGQSEQIYKDPQHPYTKALLKSIPRPDPRTRSKAPKLAGEVPSPIHLPPGCPFAGRCPLAEARCHEQYPEPRKVGDRIVSCHLVG